MVVMNGLAMTAGSKPMRFASTGSEQPTSFAASTVTTSVLHTTMATGMVTRSMSSNLTKFAGGKRNTAQKSHARLLPEDTPDVFIFDLAEGKTADDGDRSLTARVAARVHQHGDKTRQHNGSGKRIFKRGDDAAP